MYTAHLVQSQTTVAFHVLKITRWPKHTTW